MPFLNVSDCMNQHRLLKLNESEEQYMGNKKNVLHFKSRWGFAILQLKWLRWGFWTWEYMERVRTAALCLWLRGWLAVFVWTPFYLAHSINHSIPVDYHDGYTLFSAGESWAKLVNCNCCCVAVVVLWFVSCYLLEDQLIQFAVHLLWFSFMSLFLPPTPQICVEYDSLSVFFIFWILLMCQSSVHRRPAAFSVSFSLGAQRSPNLAGDLSLLP